MNKLARQEKSRLSRTWDRVRRNRPAIVGSLILITIIAIVLLAPVLPLADPNEVELANRLQPPFSKGHPLGTDNLGRDLLSRIVWGGRISLAAGFGSTALALVIGVVMGLLAGYFGGWIDNFIMRLTDVFMAFPMIMLALAIIAALGAGSVRNAVVAVGLAGYPVYARVVRSSAIPLREQSFVLAARVAGASNRRIIFRHIFPNTLTPVIVTASLDLGNTIILVSGLSFLGLGTQPPTADWGTMLADGRNFLRTAPQVATLPGLGISIVVLCFNLIGDGFRDIFDPRSGM